MRIRTKIMSTRGGEALYDYVFHVTISSLRCSISNAFTRILLPVRYQTFIKTVMAYYTYICVFRIPILLLEPRILTCKGFYWFYGGLLTI